jgi:hypothetical protein
MDVHDAQLRKYSFLAIERAGVSLADVRTIGGENTYNRGLLLALGVIGSDLLPFRISPGSFIPALESNWGDNTLRALTDARPGSKSLALFEEFRSCSGSARAHA